MLPLTDKRWSELWCREGAAQNVPARINYLLLHPDDRKSFDLLGDSVCSDGTTWSVGFGAAPYIVEMARKLPPSGRLNALIEIGLIVTCACSGSNDLHYRLEPYLADSYHQAIRDSLPLLAETLLCKMEEKDILSLVFCVAALKGHIKLAEVTTELGSCPHCSEILGRT
jgi:hypothetical protein